MPLGCKNVLVVEDDELTRESLTVLLTCAGYVVRVASDGREALARLRHDPLPDCILLDLWMPGMDGRQFLAQQTMRPEWAGVPVVVVSGDPRLAEAAAFLGAVDYVRKPVEPTALFEAVGHHC